MVLVSSSGFLELLLVVSEQMGEANPPTVHPKRVVAEGETLAATPLLLELWVGRAPRPEVLKGSIEMDNRHLRGVLRHLQHPRKLGALEGVQLAAQGSFGGFGCRGVGFPTVVLLSPLR